MVGFKLKLYVTMFLRKCKVVPRPGYVYGGELVSLNISTYEF